MVNKSIYNNIKTDKAVSKEIQHFLKIDNRTIDCIFDSIEFEYESQSNNKSINSYVFIFSLPFIILFTNLLFLLKFQNRIRKINKFIFITHYSHIIKLKSLNTILDENDYSILYIPTLHLGDIKKHYSFFSKNQNVSFLSFGFTAFILGFHLIKHLRSLFRILNKTEVIESKIGQFLIIKSILSFKTFQIVTQQYLKKGLLKNFYNHVFVFDADKPPQFSGIINVLSKNKAKCINLQHGSFFDNNKFYLPAYAQYCFCCSEREKNLYISHGMIPDNIFITGAPLQTIGNNTKNKNLKSTYILYDFLILCSSTRGKELLQIQINTIKKLSLKKNLKIRIRFRPASKKYDLDNIAPHLLSSWSVSEGVSIEDDISFANEVISFSFDSLFYCYSLNKITHLVCFNNIYKQLKESNLLHIHSDELDYSKCGNFVNNDSDNIDDFLYNFGSIDFNDNKQNFIQSLNKVLNS